jgi:hypothetical protein
MSPRTEYRAASAPNGDEEDGFAHWLLTERGLSTLSA